MPTNLNIIDPTTYPVVFNLPKKEVNLLTIKSYPISFTISDIPRPANIVSMAIKQLGTFYLNHDVYKDPNVALFSKNISHKIELNTNKKDLTKANFALKFYTSANTFLAIEPGQIQIVNQPAGIGSIISHLFSMANSTKIFNPILFDGTYYYPTATIGLKFYPRSIDTNFAWTDVILPDMSDTLVQIVPQNCYGILDVEVKVYLKWYYDEERTIPASTPDVNIAEKKFGIRFCISNKGGVFEKKIQLTYSSDAIALGLYSTTLLQTLAKGEYQKVYYWGLGERAEDLFLGDVPTLEIADNGLPIQEYAPTAIYVLDNPLVDIYSSSSSSASSVSSASSNSSSLNSSSSSISSDSSLSSISSFTSHSSISSESSTSSTSSSSSTNILDYSSSSSSSSSSTSSSSSLSSSSTLSSSSSSSTEIQDLSTSSSSIYALLLFDYAFNQKYDEFMNVQDSSDYDRTAKVRASNAPTWIETNEIIGGSYLFFSNSSKSQYIFSMDVNDLNCSKGTLSTWVKPSTSCYGKSSIIFSITNNYTYSNENKTEFDLGISQDTNALFASLIVDGEAKWQIDGPLLDGLIGKWTNIVVLHDGASPYLYIDGTLYPFTFSVEDYKWFWLNKLFSGPTYASDRLIIGATTRIFYPFYVVGFSGNIGRTKMWNSAMTEQYILDDYNNSLKS